MRSGPLNAVLVLLAVASMAVLSPGTAQAEPECQYIDPQKGICTILVEKPAIPSPSENVPEGEPVGTDSSLPCWQDLSSFTRLDPQPAAGDPLWKGRDPADGGAIYHCHIALSSPEHIFDIFLWLEEPPTAGTPEPSPQELAQVAVDSMDLAAIDVGIVPEPRPGSVGIIGMPVWMWAANPSPNTTGPISASASAGGITVNATARIHAITWSMGDGNTVACEGGTAYTASYGDAQSPDCGHVYTTTSANEPGGTFTVTATSDWVISWEGGGQTGTIRMDDLQRSVQIAVGEAQVLVTK